MIHDPSKWEAISEDSEKTSPSEILVEGIDNQALLITLGSNSPHPFTRLNLEKLQDPKGIRIGIIYREFTINSKVAAIDATPLYIGSNLYLFSDLGEYNLKALILYPIGDFSYQIKGYTLPLDSGNGGEFTGSIDWASIKNKPTLFSGDYADLSNKPTIPSKTSDLENDTNFLTSIGSIDWASIENKPSIPGSSLNCAILSASITVNDSGYFLANNLSADISLNCASLSVGKQLIIYNYSSETVYLKGFNYIDSTVIPPNNSILINPNTKLDLIVINNSNTVKILSGNYVVDFDLGYTPPQYTLTYTNNSTFNGLFNYLGTNQLQNTWGNPYPSKVSFENITNSPIINNIDSALDKKLESFMRLGVFGDSPTTFRLNLLNDLTLKVTKALIRVHSRDTSNIILTVKGIKTDGQLETIGSQSLPYADDIIIELSSTSNSLFTGFEISHNKWRINYLEIEFWGIVLL